MIRKLRTRRGFTLVELMIVVAIVGVLAALAIYGVRKYVANAKTTEARTGLGRMSKDAATAFNREGMDPNVLNFKGSAEQSSRICAKAGATVPPAQISIQGKKYQSDPDEWKLGDANTGWACLKFSMADPQYYMYGYDASGSASDGDNFTCSAEGDLNGDGNLSKFEMTGQIQKSTSGVLSVTLAPSLSETNPEE